MIGGLALDLGRVYIAKNETQSFTDTAALAAALALNDANLTAAKDAVVIDTTQLSVDDVVERMLRVIEHKAADRR